MIPKDIQMRLTGFCAKLINYYRKYLTELHSGIWKWQINEQSLAKVGKHSFKWHRKNSSHSVLCH